MALLFVRPMEIMNRIDAYIARGLILWTGIALLSASLIFMVTQAFRLAPLFAGSNMGFYQLTKVVAVLQVPVIGWALTPAFAVAVFAVAGTMSARGEMVAVDAAGIGRSRMMRLPLVAGSVLFFISAWIWLWAAPMTQMELRNISGKAVVGGVKGQLEAGRFHQPVEGFAFFADRKDAQGSYRGVYMERTVNGQGMYLVARQAAIGVRKNTNSLGIRLKQGTLFLLREKSHGALSFRTMAVDVPLESYVQDTLDFLPEQMATPTSALMGLPKGNVSFVKWKFELWRRMAKPLEFLLVALISVLLAFWVQWGKRGGAILAAGSLFLAVHMVQRAAEVLMDRGVFGAFPGAFMSSCAVCGVLLVAFGIKLHKKRLSTL